MSRVFLSALLCLLAVHGGQAAESAQRFDGEWDTILSCPNSNGALGYSFEFPSLVKEGVLHAEKGVKGQAGWLQLDGPISPDGTGHLYASGLVGAAEMAVGHRPPGTQYGYHLDVQFTDNSGKGQRVEGRPCTVTFAKKSGSDQAIQHEFDIARPEILRLNQLLNAELVHALADSGSAPSPAMKRVIEESSKSHLALGDTSVPLHQRLIERQRLEVIASFKWAAATIGHCDVKGFDPADLLDDRSRLRIKSVSRCYQHSLDRDQLEIHQLKVANEASVLELKLPPAFQERMLAEARRSMARQDAEIASTYAHRRAFWEATDNLVKFFDTHPAHLAANQIVMDDESDRLAAQDLLSRFIETAKQQ